ncbi:MAG: BREX-1 system adenine-specific DNA-methyltransferase PglX, partial [Paludibacteraceae bacterium]|nr:BREX-1 system adenine-specific DNA-methyltransferase PglX [Paludibacteraceae bacterium]
ELTDDYSELLLSLSYIDQDGVVFRLVNDIPEADFNIEQGGQVEIIGWLYQYYNTEPKDQVFANLKKNIKISKDAIPAATQLFTPDWIVRYMVQNSLGRLWVEGHPNDELKAGWKYYLEEAEQEPEVEAQLVEIRKKHAALAPEDIKFIDPCMGSGHILVYAFDVLMQIYRSAGWSDRDAAASIVEHNLHGLDIDRRAAQLAYFAVMMKARQYDRRALSRELQPNVYAIVESNNFPRSNLRIFGELYSLANTLLEDMRNAKVYGSIARIGLSALELDALHHALNSICTKEYDNLYDFSRRNAVVNEFAPLLHIAEVLTQQYEIVVTNPPYMGSGGMCQELAEYVREHYPDSKGDLSTAFMEKALEMCDSSGFVSMINIPVWMFLSSYGKLRRNLICNKTLVNMAHIGRGIFGSDLGTTSFVFQNSSINDYKGKYLRLFKEQVEIKSPEARESDFFEPCGVFVSTQMRFLRIPGCPIAYWLSDAFIKPYKGKTLGDVGCAKSGLQTGDNNKFMRIWSEVDIANVAFDVRDKKRFVICGKKWLPQVKGGEYRKWYGNIDYIVNWENDGEDIKKCTSSRLNAMANDAVFLKRGITWSHTTSGVFGARILPSGFLFNVEAPTYFCDDFLYDYILGMMNSCISQQYLSALNGSVHYLVGNIVSLPIIIDESIVQKIKSIVNDCVRISKEDWDNYEVSWDFKEHPFVTSARWASRTNEWITVQQAYEDWQGVAEGRFQELKANEEELNRIFIEIYGLQDELKPDVEEKDVTVRRADLKRDVKSMLSYAVGCMFGRYNLFDKPGLAFAGGEWDASKYHVFQPDADNIIPITDEQYLEDDIISRLCSWLCEVFGKDNLETNLNYIAKAIGGKGDTSRGVIRSYLLNDFFKDHCQTYSVTGSGKRPIYWLFDSGKQNGFKALVYLHRYTPDTIGTVRVDYLHKLQRIYENEINRMQDMMDHSGNAREVAAASKRKEKLQKQLKECREYDEKLAHLALSRIELDLDDGVKVNYRKVQTAQDGKFYEVLADSKNIMAKEK